MTTLYKFTATGGDSNCYIKQNVSMAGTYVQEVTIREAKTSGSSVFMVDQYFAGISDRQRAKIDLSDNSVEMREGNSSNVTVSELSDGWVRVSVITGTETGLAQVRFGAHSSLNSDEVFAKDFSFKAQGSSVELLSNVDDPTTGWQIVNTTIDEVTSTTTLAPTTTASPTTTPAPTTTASPTTTPDPTTTASPTSLSDYVEIRNSLLSALKELNKVSINQYSVQERQVIHERRSEIRKELQFYDRKIALLQGQAKGRRSPTLGNFRDNDSI